MFPQGLKTTINKLLWKKKNVETALLNYYGSHSNIPFFSKLVFFAKNNCFNVFQSRFRLQHSTEKLLVSVFNNTYFNPYSEFHNFSPSFTGYQCCILTVVNNILQDRPENWVGTGTVVYWADKCDQWGSKTLHSGASFVQYIYMLSLAWIMENNKILQLQ